MDIAAAAQMPSSRRRTMCRASRRVEQDAAGTRHWEAAQAWSGGCDGDGQIEGKEGFAALGLTADDADGFVRPEPADQPVLLLGTLGEAMGWLDGKLCHRRRLAASLVLLTVVAA